MYRITPAYFCKKTHFIRTVLPSTTMQIVRISSGQQMISEKKMEVSEDAFFYDFLKYRKNQACRSVAIKLEGQNDIGHLQNLCNFYGKDYIMFNYQINNNNFVLVEFQKIDELKNFLSDSKNGSITDLIRIEGKEFMSFKKRKSQYNVLRNDSNVKIVRDSASGKLTAKQLLQTLSNDSIDDLLFTLYDNLKLNELGVRLRFLTCRQIESIVQGLMPEACVFPFGSSVSGLGLNGCDLDLVILKENSVQPIVCDSEETHSLIARSIMQNHLDILSQILSNFGKGCSSVTFIKHARVPIVKYKNEYTGVECDLSLYHNSGLKMTQMLYIYLNMDRRVKPLLNFIRIWAKSLGLLSPKAQPNSNLSNFSLTVLVIFFLQQSSDLHPAILPSMKYFPIQENSAFLNNEDVTLLINDFKSKNELNKKSLSNLLLLYFKFYSQFDFSKCGCCVYTGEIINKTQQFSLCSVYIKNPFEIANVSRNVSKDSLKNFQKCASRAYEMLYNSCAPAKGNNSTVLQLMCNKKNYKEINTNTHNNMGSLNVKNIFC